MSSPLLKVLVVVALVAALPATGQAQHSAPRDLLKPPSTGENLRCRAIAPPNPTLPPSVQSFEFTYMALRFASTLDTVLLVPHQRLTAAWDSAGRLVMVGSAHDPTPSDSLKAGFIMVASASEPFAGQWITLDGTVRADPMSVDDLKRAEDLANFMWTRRCPGSATSRRTP